MILHLSLLYILTYLISIKYLLTYFFLVKISHILNYNSNVIFYFTLPYNFFIILITFIKLKLGKYRFFKKFFKKERRVKKNLLNLKKNIRLYFRRKKMNERIKSVTKRITDTHK